MSRLQKSTIFAVLALLIFFTYRIFLFLTHYDTFVSLNALEVCRAFIGGIRFDISIVFTFFALPLLMMNLPIRHAKHKLWFGFWGMMLYLFVLIAALILIGDIIYFDAVKRHMGRELMALSNDFSYIVDMVISSYKLLFLVFILCSLGLLAIWIKILIIDKAPLSRPLLKFVFIFFILFIGARGTLSSKPINIIDAFSSGDAAYANLCLNGVFTSYHSMRKSRAVDHSHFINDKEYEILDIAVKEYPLMKRHAGRGDRLNVVFVLMESWGYRYLDSFGGNGFGVTPNFDSMAEEGLKFVNFYAAGQRSIDGLQSTLTGIPTLSGTPSLGAGLEISNFSRLGSIAGEMGYRTIFIQSSKRRSFRVNSIASAAGFEEYYGKEDMPVLLDYSDPGGAKFGWDYETYMLLKKKLEEMEGPFLAYLFTGTTHTPYPDLGEKFSKFPKEANGEGGFLNALNYSDWSLGEFMKFAKSQPWFDRTVFVFSADHASNYEQGSTVEKFKIPFLIYAPEIFEAETVKKVGSQLDVLATLLDIMGFEGEFASLGTSLLDDKERYAMVNEGEVLGIFGQEGYLTHSLKSRLDTGAFGKAPSPEYFDGLEKRLLAMDQLSYELIHSNRWAR